MKVKCRKLDESVKCEEPTPRNYHLQYADVHVLVATFIRIQEFYECPDRRISRRFFTLERLWDSYAERHGAFTYFDDWSGFNIPGPVILEFHRAFAGNLLIREGRLFDLLTKKCDLSDSQFYLSASKLGDSETRAHEIAHGLWFLDDEYREDMLDEVDSLGPQKTVFRNLRRMGYADTVLEDETQAYLSTGRDWYLKEEFKLRNPEKTAAPFRKIYKRHTCSGG